MTACVYAPWRRQQGMSLTELLVAMVLSLGIVGTVISVFVASKHSYLVQDNVAWMQENARHAFRKLGYDIRMSGYLGDLQEYWNLIETIDGTRKIPGAVAGECFTTKSGGGAFRWIAPMLANDGAALPSYGPKLFGADNDDGDFGCLTVGTALSDYRAGTDVLSAHYAEPAAIAAGSLTANRYYINTALRSGRLFQCDVTASCVPTDAPAGGTNHALYAAVYYISPCGRAGNDGACNTSDDVPALMRVKLEDDGTIGRDRMAEGVIDMQIQYGVDSTGDGLADRYIDSPNTFRDATTWINLATVKAVRVWLLMRVREPGYTDPNGDYVFADVSITPTSGYRYQLFTSTFSVRNQYSAAAAF